MTPAVVAAERAGIAFTLHEYEHEAGAAYGPEAAAKTGVDPARVFKTLVVAQDGALSVAIVPVAAQLDLRALGSGPRWQSAVRPSARPATCSAGSARSGSGSGCRRSSTCRRSCTRRSSSAPAAGAWRSSSPRTTSSGSPARGWRL